MQTEFLLDQVYLDQWVEVEAAEGTCFICIDGFVVGETSILLWECKLTFTPEMAWYQLEKRYAPVLRVLFPGKRLATLQVCRNLAFGRPVAAADRRTPKALFEAPEAGRFVYHWLGR